MTFVIHARDGTSNELYDIERRCREGSIHYPAGLNRVRGLTAGTGFVAQLLFTLLGDHEEFSVVYRQFADVVDQDEGCVRRAFARLEELGIVSCVSRGRGRYAKTRFAFRGLPHDALR